MTSEKILRIEDLGGVGEQTRQEGKTVVLANGVFDLIHVGHVRYLEGAKREGDLLVVAINDDPSVRAMKGEGRPAQPLAERMEVIAALACVDHVVPFSGANVEGVLRRLRPQVHAKGTDYTAENVPERETDRAIGARVAIVGDPKDHSSSALLKTLGSGEEKMGAAPRTQAEACAYPLASSALGKVAAPFTGASFSSFLVRKRVAIGNVFLMLVAVTAKPEKVHLTAAVVLVLLGHAIRIWAGGYLRKRTALTTSGPYRWVRHPLYVGSFLLGLGLSIASGRTWVIPCFSVMFAMLYGLAAAEEERQMASAFGQAYRHYRKAVYGFLPLRRAPACHERFSMKRALGENREYRSWLGTLLLAGVVLVKYRLG
ncbi:MAG: adenylyltransferase/cytidyltransferase family protein [Nitrospirae bacterium]|nr:adenylyltransferase/cytidyltransferase family protein [Nitrospirota bacterium]